MVITVMALLYNDMHIRYPDRVPALDRGESGGGGVL